jgi:hypothetical protein
MAQPNPLDGDNGRMATYPSPGHTDPELTPEQVANCRKLAAYLRTLPADYPDFEMSSFTNEGERGEGYAPAYDAPCGTAACAAGHGPRAGIEPDGDEDWESYSERCFAPDSGGENSPWEWCFSGSWYRVDNTVHGAAARIKYMLTRGVPKNVYDQRRGVAPLSYTVEA